MTPPNGARESSHDGPSRATQRCVPPQSSTNPAAALRRTAVLLASLAGAACQRAAPPPDPAAVVARGRYMVLTGHCNNCHTAGYAANAGDVPESRWLTGNPVGWRGRNGTVFAPNLRLYTQALTEEQWLVNARQARPRAPMPWWSLAETSDDDLRAMYRYIRGLQPAGDPAPAFLPPDAAPTPPYTQLPELSVPR